MVAGIIGRPHTHLAFAGVLGFQTPLLPQTGRPFLFPPQPDTLIQHPCPLGFSPSLQLEIRGTRTQTRRFRVVESSRWKTMIAAGLPYPFDVEVKPAGSLSLRVLKISLTLLLALKKTVISPCSAGGSGILTSKFPSPISRAGGAQKRGKRGTPTVHQASLKGQPTNLSKTVHPRGKASILS